MTDGRPAEPDLDHARRDVLAVVAGSAMAKTPHLEAAGPLRPLPPQLEAKLGHPGEGTPVAPALDAARRAVVPASTLAGLDLAGVVVAAATGHVVLAVVAGVLFVPLAALAIAALRTTRDPSRLTAADRLQVAAASRWRSRQPWTGAIASSNERGLVIAATRAAERITRTPAWRSGRAGRFDLAAELDRIDEQAHRVATARAADGGDPALEQAWNATVDRVAALTAYADELDGTARERRIATDSPRTATDPEVDHLLALEIYLGAQFGNGPQP